jgi:hypothetical protein
MDRGVLQQRQALGATVNGGTEHLVVRRVEVVGREEGPVAWVMNNRVVCGVGDNKFV